MQNVDFYDIMIKNIKKELECAMINKEDWETPKFSKKEIVNAGKILSSVDRNKEDEEFALNVLNNWRASHAYPLQVIASNLRKNNPNAVVAQRLKRLDSIIHKLKRYPNMSLYRMQDLGGCRVIVDSISDVYAALNKYKNSKIRHILKHEKDYIKTPKDTGYRGYHAVYQFYSDTKDTYNKNMLIEIQFRTKLQHIWATAIEMMELYTNSALKSNIGDPQILRFFVLVSSIFAMHEGMPVVPNTSNNYNHIVEEIRNINRDLNILNALQALSTVMQQTKGNIKENGYCILILNFSKMILNIIAFPKSQVEIATKIYNQIEQQNNPNINVVLVSASSLNMLKAAYPNYFTDISEFIKHIKNII